MQAIEDFYPLSPAQQGMLFHALYDPRARLYSQQSAMHLEGELDVEAFRRAWQRVMERHAVLRSSFVWDSVKEPVQVVHRRVELPLEQHDLSRLPPGERESALAERWRAEQERGLELSSPPLMRLVLVRVGASSHRLLWSWHHILLDGWSRLLVSREALALYEAYSRGRDLRLPPPRPYRDYIVWLRRQGLSRAEAYWRRTLKGFTASTPLWVESGPAEPPGEGDGYREHQVQLSEDVTAALQALGRARRLTLNTLVQGAWALLLSRYAGTHDVVFGSVVSGRPPELEGVESMVGLFANALPVRVNVSGHEPLVGWLRKLQQQQVEMQGYEHSPLVEVQRWSELPPGEPLFKSLLAFQNYPAGPAPGAPRGGLAASVRTAVEPTSYPLTVMISSEARLMLRALYDRRQVSPAAVAGMMEHFRLLLEDIASDPERSVSALSFVTSGESRRLVADFNAVLE